MIQELKKLCCDLQFDRDYALQLLREVDPNTVFSASLIQDYTYLATLLSEAAENGNIRMVELLLKNGADPNLIFDDGSENVLWNLQYPGDDLNDNANRLQIAQLMLEHGANPQIVVEDESLFSYVLFTVFNDDVDDLWKYRVQFFILLVAFGGKSHYCVPKIVKEFDKSNMRQYRFYMIPEGNGLYSGIIVDTEGNIFAYL